MPIRDPSVHVYNAEFVLIARNAYPPDAYRTHIQRLLALKDLKNGTIPRCWKVFFPKPLNNFKDILKILRNFSK